MCRLLLHLHGRLHVQLRACAWFHHCLLRNRRPAAAALVDLLTKYEHTPVLVAGTLRYTIVQWDDGRLVRCRWCLVLIVMLQSHFMQAGLRHSNLLCTADCGCLAVCLQAAAVLGEIAAVDPAEYERQQNASGEKAGVRSVAAFVKEMAAQLPRWEEGMDWIVELGPANVCLGMHAKCPWRFWGCHAPSLLVNTYAVLRSSRAG